MPYVLVGVQLQDDGALRAVVQVSFFHVCVDLPAYFVVERVQAIFCHEQHSVGAITRGLGWLSYQTLGDFCALPYGEFCWVMGREGAIERPVR